MARLNIAPDYLGQTDTSDLAYAAQMFFKNDWATVAPNPVPTARETTQCPPHLWHVGGLGVATTCRKCGAKKKGAGVTFAGYEQTSGRQNGVSLRMRASPR